MVSNKLRTIALFAGCGGLACGFRNAGFDIVAAFENWDAALMVFQQNFPTTSVFKQDLEELNDDYDVFRQFHPDLIIGGPPCQDYSHAGKRNEELGRADLTVSFASIVVNVRPQWFVMENVDRIQKSKRLPICLSMYRAAGYGLTEQVLNASLCGVPQARKRYFLVGHLGGSDGFLSDYLRSNLSKKPTTVRDYLGDSLGVNYYYRHPRNYSRRAVFGLDEPSPTIRGVNRPIPKNYVGHPGDAAPISSNVRPLTTIERSYIQTFPRDYIFDSSKTNLEQMIGNAVPVKLAEYVGRCLSKYINDTTSEDKRQNGQLALLI
ncbi:DNA cytosine methyltransferase [Chloroflexota bacterium]